MKTILGLWLVVVLFAPSMAWSKIGGGDIVFRPTGADAVVYSHEGHAKKAGLKCSECHYKLYSTVGHKKKYTMKEMEEGQSCGACHNGQRAFEIKNNCKRCHK